MANIWKDKVLPSIKKVFDKGPSKKTQAAEAIKAFDESKEQYTVDFEEKKGELQPKVVEIYEALTVQVKGVVKDPKVAGLKKHSAGVQRLLDELVKIEFPGSKSVAETATKLGPTYVPGPITFVFEKVLTLLPVVVKEEAAPAAATAEAKGESSAATEEVKVKEIVAEAEKKEEAAAKAVAAEEDKVEAPAEAAAPAAEKEEEEKKKEEAAVAAEPPKA